MIKNCSVSIESCGYQTSAFIASAWYPPHTSTPKMMTSLRTSGVHDRLLELLQAFRSPKIQISRINFVCQTVRNWSFKVSIWVQFFQDLDKSSIKPSKARSPLKWINFLKLETFQFESISLYRYIGPISKTWRHCRFYSVEPKVGQKVLGKL